MLTTSMTLSERPKSAPVLLVWPGVPAWHIDGKLYLDRKFKDGMDIWAVQWPGKLRAVMEVIALKAMPPFGACLWQPPLEKFDLALIEPGSYFCATHLEGVDVLLANADDPLKLASADLCLSAGVSCVFSIEYTLSTRLHMTLYSDASRYQKLKTSVWLLLNELRIRRAIAKSSSVQANGIPAFDMYARAKPHGHLYFDTRLSAHAVISLDVLEARLKRLRAGHPLRLAFSGRLIAAKGADALVPLAMRLRQMGVDFKLDIYGSGDLEAVIDNSIRKNELGEWVKLHGAVDFETALIPIFQHEVDIFVCCHRQGDPSCTYAETLGCGVPFAGYANESLKTLVDRFDVGWIVGMNDDRALAELIYSLSEQRERICAKAMRAREFGLANSFESTFKARLDHCMSVIA